EDRSRNAIEQLRRRLGVRVVATRDVAGADEDRVRDRGGGNHDIRWIGYGYLVGSGDVITSTCREQTKNPGQGHSRLACDQMKCTGGVLLRIPRTSSSVQVSSSSGPVSDGLRARRLGPALAQTSAL